MESGRVTSRELVAAVYDADRAVTRIVLNATAYVSRTRARRSRRSSISSAPTARVRGPLHGIPIAVKDNINTTDMPTTGGALAFEGIVPPYEATLIDQSPASRRGHHRQDGADRAGELGAPTAMPANYSALVRLRLEPVRSAARSAAGTERRRAAGAGHRRVELRHRHGRQLLGRQRRHRDIGIDSRARRTQNMLVGIKPTVGRDQPLRRHSDHRRSGHRRTDGAHRHRCRDPARCAGGPGPIRNDPATNALHAAARRDYTRFLQRAGLRGARIGIPRATSTTTRSRARTPARPSAGSTPQQLALMERGHPDPAKRRRNHRRSGRHPERRRRHAGEQLSDFGDVRRFGEPPGHGHRLLDRPQVRHEARLQRLRACQFPVHSYQFKGPSAWRFEQAGPLNWQLVTGH